MDDPHMSPERIVMVLEPQCPSLGWAMSDALIRGMGDSVVLQRPSSPAAYGSAQHLAQVHRQALEKHVGQPWWPVLFFGTLPVVEIEQPDLLVWEDATAEALLDTLEHLSRGRRVRVSVERQRTADE